LRHYIAHRVHLILYSIIQITRNQQANYLYSNIVLWLTISLQETEKNTDASNVFPLALNIIKNHDFSDGLYSWNTNGCDSFVVSSNDCNLESNAVVNNRSETWQGLEQDITDNVSPGFSYKVSASVSVSGPVLGSAQVLATLKLEHKSSATEFQLIGK